MGQVPLERALSKLGFASRRQTREWIKGGRICVNGKLIKDPDFPVVPEAARISLDGRAIKRAAPCTIMMYKPKGIVTTRSDEKGRRTVYDLLPSHWHHLHPVGRLDMASCGLLLMTTDTQFSNLLTDPQNKIPRVYAVTVNKLISEDDLKILSAGIKDQGQLLKASKIAVRKSSGKETHLIIELTEGRNREIRRMFEYLGSEVTALKRIEFGQLKLGDLRPGEVREVEHNQIAHGLFPGNKKRQ